MRTAHTVTVVDRPDKQSGITVQGSMTCNILQTQDQAEACSYTAGSATTAQPEADNAFWFLFFSGQLIQKQLYYIKGTKSHEKCPAPYLVVHILLLA